MRKRKKFALLQVLKQAKEAATEADKLIALADEAQKAAESIVESAGKTLDALKKGGRPPKKKEETTATPPPEVTDDKA